MQGKNKQVNIKYLALNAIYSNLLSASKEMKKEIYAQVYTNKDKSKPEKKTCIWNVLATRKEDNTNIYDVIMYLCVYFISLHNYIIYLMHICLYTYPILRIILSIYL